MLVTSGKHDLEANQVADVGYLVHTSCTSVCTLDPSTMQ